MTLNRRGDARRMSDRKKWLTGAIALGTLAASGGAATAAFAHSSNHGPSGSWFADADQFSGTEVSADDDAGNVTGKVCLLMDGKGQQAVAAAGEGDKVYVPMDKVEVVPCPSGGSTDPGGAPTEPGSAPADGPSGAPTDPGSAPAADPSGAPTDPGNAPADPSGAPSDPGSQPGTSSGPAVTSAPS